MSMIGTDRDERERQAYSLLARGANEKTIADILGVTVSTVKKYINARREVVLDVINRVSQQDYAVLVLERFSQIRQEIWANYQSAEKEKDKIKYMELLMKVESQEQENLTKLGLLERQAEKVEHVIQGDVALSEVDHSRLEALTALVISQRVGNTPEGLLAMRAKENYLLNEASRYFKEEPEDVTPVLEKIKLD